MTVLNIAIIGGSIAGCSVGIALSEQGHDVRIYERSRKNLEDRGAGIVMPLVFVDALRKRDWLDADAPCVSLSSMYYRRRQSMNDKEGETFWERPMPAVSWRWGQLFAQLRKRVQPGCYSTGFNLKACQTSVSGSAVLEFENGVHKEADLVIYADGLYSVGRSYISPSAVIRYAGYLLWRGVLSERLAPRDLIPKDSILWHVLGGGLGGSYPIASLDGDMEVGKRSLNWGIYQRCSEVGFQKMFNGLTEGLDSLNQATSLHDLPDSARGALRELLEENLPQRFAEFFSHDSKPFLQAIVDVCADCLVEDNSVLVGDAAAVLRPHTAAGAVKAIENALSLQASLADTSDPRIALQQWQRQELPKLRAQQKLSQSLGNSLILEAPDWSAMDNEKMTAWWDATMAGKTWYLK